MSNEAAIAIGDKIDLVENGGDTYKTILGDITEDGSLLVVLPSRRGVPVELELGDVFKLFFYRQSGRFCMDVKAGGFMMSNSVRLVRFLPMSAPRKEQRRENYRLPASLKTLVCQYAEEGSDTLLVDDAGHEIAYTSDISVSGVSLRTRQVYTVGERLLLRVYLGWPSENSPPLDIYSEVRRVSPILDSDRYQVGFYFLQMRPEDSEIVGQFVLEQQRKRIKQQRLIEED